MNNQQTVITLSQTTIAAFTAMGWSNAQIAEHYGVTTQEISRAKTSFGMYKNRTKSKAEPAYTIQLSYDLPVTNVAAQNNSDLVDEDNFGYDVVDNTSDNSEEMTSEFPQEHSTLAEEQPEFRS